MKIFLATMGTRGDIEPFVHLATAALNRGDSVTAMATAEFKNEFDPRVNFVALPGSIRDLVEQTKASPAVAAKIFSRVIKPVMVDGMDILFTTAKLAKPDVIVFHPKIVAAPLVASAVNAVAVQVEFAPITVPTSAFASAGVGRYSLGRLNRLTYSLVNRGSAQLFATELRQRARDWGASPAPVTTVIAVSPALVHRPNDYAASAFVTGQWASDRVDAVSQQILDFCQVPTVAINFGSMTQSNETIATLIDGIREQGRRVLLIGGWSGADSSFTNSNDLLAVSAVDHNAVFPLCEAIVHHGGAGTTHAVARAGRPQWVIPVLADQPWWRDLTVLLGIGVRGVSRRKLTAASVHKELEKLLSLQVRAKEVSSAMAGENGVDATLRLCDSLVAGN
ncbi:MAG: hypothetical protein RJA31_197 [Actinomycetota bacterium]|jgi:sterol 3beta-glucosyltransferase